MRQRVRPGRAPAGKRRAGLAALAAAAGGASLWLLARRAPAGSMHPADWLDGAGVCAPRRYRSPGHFLFHLRGLLALAPLAPRVHLGRAMDPALREKIMIVTAIANACPS